MGLCGKYAKMACGVILVVMVDAIWVCASYIVQLIYSLESANSYNNTTNTSGEDTATPYLLTTVANSLFIIYLPIAAISHCAATTTNQHKADNLTDDGNGEESTKDRTHSNIGAEEENANLLLDDESASNDNQFCACLYAGSSRLTKPIVCRNAKWAFITCWFWFGANFSYNWSLRHTSVSSNTIISSSCVRAYVQGHGRFMLEHM